MTSHPLIGLNESTTTLMTMLTSPVTQPTLHRHNRSMIAGRFPSVRPTVSLDAGPIVIPILSCVICFPVLAFALICALRYRAIRLRKKDQLKRTQSGCRSVTLEIPHRDRSSFYSKDSSSDPSLKGFHEISQTRADSPPLLSAPSTSGTSSSRRSSRASNAHVKFMTTTAVFHGRTITGLNGRFKSKSKKIFWDEHSSHVDSAQELEKELSQALDS